jgi:cytoskeletal protein CcmA (bactofilin family)
MALFNDETQKTLEQRMSGRSQPAPVQNGPAQAPAQNGTVQNGQGPQQPGERILPPPSQAALTPGGNRAYLDQGCEINGKLTFEGPIRIDGLIEGEINGHDSITIGKTAVVTAKIKAVSIVVAGTVNGDLSASQRIELQPSAKVSGSLTAPKLVILEGAGFEGSCTMQPKAVREDRKMVVSAPRKEDRPMSELNGQDRAGQL